MTSKLSFYLVCGLLLFGLWVPTQARESADQDHVVILLDASGSMMEPMQGMRRMDAAKKAIAAVLKLVPEDTQVGLLVFSEDNPGSDWVVPLGPRDDQTFIKKLLGVKARGGTPLGAYMKLAADALLEQRDKQLGYGTYRLLIVTDGEAGDPKKVERFAPDILRRNITMDVIGVAMQNDHQLKQMANSYRRADDPKSLETAISEVLAEVPSSGGDAAYEEAFELLQGIDGNMAQAMIQGLTSVDNAPIGSVPTPRIGANGQDGNNVVGQSGSSSTRTKSFNFGLVKVLVILFVLALIFKSMSRKKR